MYVTKCFGIHGVLVSMEFCKPFLMVNIMRCLQIPFSPMVLCARVFVCVSLLVHAVVTATVVTSCFGCMGYNADFVVSFTELLFFVPFVANRSPGWSRG